MAMQNGELSKELLSSQAHIWNHIFSFINSMSLKCAVQLQIPDIIHHHGSPMLLSELVEALGLKHERTHSLYRLMRILVHSGFFLKQSRGNDEEEGEEEGYLLAPASRLLLKEEPLSIRPFLLAMLDPMLLDPWQHMSRWFQNDDTNTFHNNPWDGLDSIVDVGGGTGAVAKAVAEAFPDIRCICFDLPHVVSGLVGSNNLSYIGGDMFEAIPNAHALLLKWILHDWSDEECMKILKQCKEAIPSKENGGKLIIIDMVVKVQEGENKLLKTQLFFDILMMSMMKGRERTEKDWAKLFVDAGYSDYKITPILGLRSLIEVYP
ncbi:hypothetical protein SSX86_032690 [Deinandra increscens subsp. villosa]|uniref:O-methyltransferase n=1 Tax=Deinandra increscens subsp. villosa TaxID=3103831 RepID=A0AAP0GGN0_9ASTR